MNSATVHPNSPTDEQTQNMVLWFGARIHLKVSQQLYVPVRCTPLPHQDEQRHVHRERVNKCLFPSQTKEQAAKGCLDLDQLVLDVLDQEHPPMHRVVVIVQQ